MNILRKREDGYHDIESVFQQIDLADTIELSACQTGIELICSHPDVPSDDSNLCYQAARRLQEFTGKTDGVRIELYKHIPVGAGLGGGSSDAAVVLKVLNQQWNLQLAPDVLQTVGRQLGADVPFFLTGKTMFARGIGDILSPVRLASDYKILIVYPGFSVSTHWAYKNYKINLTNSKKTITLADLFLADLDLRDLTQYLKNDFEEVVFERYPQLDSIKSRLYSMGAYYASMSGSGSSVFGLFHPDANFSENLASLFGFGCAVFPAKPII